MNQKYRAFFFLFCALGGYSHRGQASQGLLRYGIKQGFAQGALLLKAKKVKTVLADHLSPESIKRPLRLSQEILAFAKTIPMKTGSSYTRFVNLNQDWVTQAIIAADKDQLEPHKFHFPILGDLPYKGFFDEEDAKDEEEELAPKYDVFRRKVPAFSSLGWFSDPLTSNLIKTDAGLVETLFHELVHLNFYFDGQSDFNEAFATWFSYKASEEFAKSAVNVENRDELLAHLRVSRSFDDEIGDFLEEVLRVGKGFYTKRKTRPEIKREVFFDWIKECAKSYPNLKGLALLNWNNAVVLSFATYQKVIPAIEMYAQNKKLDYKMFFAEVMKRGAAIVPEIVSLPVPPSSAHCAQINLP